MCADAWSSSAMARDNRLMLSVDNLPECNMEAPGLSDDVYAAQAVYSKIVLTVYDWAVLGFSNRFLWRCPTLRLLALYNCHVTANHLDVGVGTGFFLDHCTFPGPAPRVALLDLNENCLRRTATRIARYHPETIRASVMEAIPYTGQRFDSIGMNYVLHCLPGNIHTKARSLDHLTKLVHPGGVVFVRDSTFLKEFPAVSPRYTSWTPTTADAFSTIVQTGSQIFEMRCRSDSIDSGWKRLDVRPCSGA